MAEEHHGDSQFASTLAQGIDVLACFQPGERVLGNKDFSLRTGLSPSTIARLTHTLVQLGYLRRDPGSRKYRPGLALLSISHPLLANMRLRQAARPLMQRLALRINGAVSLVIRDRLHMVYVETARANEELQTHPDIGAALPMLSTAAGKAWLCQAPAAERDAVLNQLRIHCPQEHERHMPQLEAARREFAKHGYCSNNRHWRQDTYGFAVPVSRPVDSNVFVLNCGVPAEDGAFEQRASEIPPQLITMVRGIEAILGWS
ncbi:IclR family transcriptional regulator [Parapusillimonas granuli]|uniref:IclR family transcriptional regulator n=1 Tax=Parapusillimonas granuli TaxID=380911 RepID=A0A853G064_9BURK|nr:IclR family transcriptional regulator [Parapusillimonas granuli]MBB5215616.1 DNA-binding IclR family transcriptional regulator [Parapusillimonas granuli]MEB2401006.1 IclR family transcriptional regulator [Alcaligenaceae bacterium]NYT49717.1 IclR family transcriptional regulator [Parapusillimonas granuli]